MGDSLTAVGDSVIQAIEELRSMLAILKTRRQGQLEPEAPTEVVDLLDNLLARFAVITATVQ